MAKIVNQTKWQTKHLQRFVNWAAAREIDSAAKRKRLVVTFKVSRTGLHGRASVGGVRSTIWIPATLTDNNGEGVEHFKAGLISVLCHELAHNRGLHGEHSMRKSGRYGWRNRQGVAEYKTLYAFAADFPLELVEEAPKAPVNLQEKAEAEIASIEAAIARWESKAKRCKTAIAKYQRKLKYRQDKVAAITAGLAPAVRAPGVRAPRPVVEKLVAPADWARLSYSQKFLRAALPHADHLEIDADADGVVAYLSAGWCFEDGLHMMREESPARLLEYGISVISACECEDCVASGDE